MASEVLKEKCVRAMTNAENTLLTVTADHTFTILNISFCETAGAAETFALYLAPAGGSADTYNYKPQALGSNETFEHTTRLVMNTTDVLYGRTASSADVDVVISYLDQTL